MRIKVKFVRLLLFGTFLLTLTPLSANTWGHEILPANPVAGQPLDLRVNLIGCPLPRANADGDYYWVTRTDNELHFFLTYAPTLCGTPPQGPTEDFELGNLEAGEYVLHWYHISNENLFPINPDDFAPAGQISFGVAPAPIAAPLLATPLLVLLALSLLALGLVSLRKF